jgi:hypothetical protein
VTGAFVYLVLCSARNRFRTRLKRLRQPRYLVGFIVGGLYLYFIFIGPVGRSPGRGGPPGWSVESMAGMMTVGLSVLLFVGVALAWLLPGRRRAIEFTRPEVQFLFTAPVSRRELIHYKLVRGQFGAFVSSVIFALLFRPGSLGRGLMVAAGLWLAFGLINLHLTGVALSRASLVEHGASGRRRFGLPALVVLGAVLTVGGTVAAAWPALAALTSGRAVLDEVVRLLTTGVAGAVLWPFRMLATLPFASSSDATLRALGPVAGLYVLNYLWVVRSETAFEEASAESAEKRARHPLAEKPKVRKSIATPFRLAARGRVETAILWKNLILVSRYVSLRLLFRMLPLVIVFGVMFSEAGERGLAQAAGAIAAGLLVMTVMIGPMMARNDLRQDLANLAVLKTWPVTGATLLRGQVLAPVMLLSGLAVLLIVAAGSLLSGVIAKAGVTTWALLGYVAAAVILAPALILGQVVLQNAIAVFFPAWVSTSGTRARGIDVMGQRILLTFGTFLGLLVGLIPAGLAAGVTGAALYAISGRVIAVIPALAGAAVILVECWVATQLLGAVLDRTDISAVEAEER